MVQLGIDGEDLFLAGFDLTGNRRRPEFEPRRREPEPGSATTSFPPALPPSPRL